MKDMKLAPEDQEELENYLFENAPAEEADPNDLSTYDEEMGTGPEKLRMNEAAYSTSGIPKGPDGGFRTTDAIKPTASVVKKLSDTDTIDPIRLQQKRYEDMLKELRTLQSVETSQRKNVDLLRGGNQIAQAIASGYGGKLGDGMSQADALAQSASKPVDDLLKRFKLDSSLTSMMRPDRQVIQLQQPDGTVKSFLLDKRTQEVSELGTTGFAPIVNKNTLTGNDQRISRQGSMGQITGGTISNAAPENQPNFYEYADFMKAAPKVAKDYIEPIKKEFNADIKESREIATSISTMQGKLTSPNVVNDFIDKGLLGGIQTQAAKMAGQRGVLTDQDLAKFEGAGGVKPWFDRLAAGAIKGEISEADKEFFRYLVKRSAETLDKDINNRSLFYASKIQQVSKALIPDMSIDNAKKWLSVDQVAPATKQIGKVGQTDNEEKKQKALDVIKSIDTELQKELTPELRKQYQDKKEQLKLKFGLT